MYGVEVYYIPRKYLTKTTVIEEVIQSEFNNAYPIEAYVNNYDGYDGQGTLLSKFGIQDLDDLTLIISKDRYENYITPLIKDLPNIELATRPKEGDLIYFPYGDRLFEIKFVEHEKPFYQLQKNYVYELRCELYRYSSEVINTGVDEIDDNFQDQGYIQTYKTLGIGETAAAYTGIVNGALSLFTFSDKGYGYNAPVTLGLSTAPSGGVDAAGIVTGRTTYGSSGDQFLTIQGVELTNPGAGYTVAPLITFTGKTTGVGAVATVGIATEGAVGFVTVTDVGSNYSIEPTVTFEDPPPYRGVLYGSWNTEFYISNAGGTVTGSNGSGYSPGTYNLTGGSGSGATLTVTQSSGAITGATGGLSFATGGQNYEVGDVLLIDGGNRNSYIKVGLTTVRTPGPGTTATGRAILSNNTVTAVRITNAGAGYTIAPTITFGLPNQVGSGNFQFNETVTGSSGNTGIVKSWNVGTKELKVSNLTGDFINGEVITGETSGAQHKIVILNTITDNPLISDNTYDVPEDSSSTEETNPSSSYNENVNIQSEGDDILDFTERNPFGRV